MSEDGGRPNFGVRLRELRKAQRYSGSTLAAALMERIDGYSVSAEAVTAWERGRFGPRHRHVVQALDDILSADGELLELAGYGVGVSAFSERLDAVEAELTRQRQVLEAVLDRLPEPPPSASPHR